MRYHRIPFDIRSAETQARSPPPGRHGVQHDLHRLGAGLRGAKGTDKKSMIEQSSAQQNEAVCGKDADSDTNVGAIRACVASSLETYLHQLNGHDCVNLHSLVLAEVEPPLLTAVLSYCNGNQTKAAQLLGLNRGTLRKKLVQYGIDH